MGQYATFAFSTEDWLHKAEATSAARGDDTTHNLDRNFAQLLLKSIQMAKNEERKSPLNPHFIKLCIPVSIYIRRYIHM